MLLTREFDYAVSIMRVLRDGEKHSVKSICAEEQIPEPFTYKILKKLESKEIVKSIRGAKGGYMLAKNMSELNLMDIMLAIEPVFGIVECTKIEEEKEKRIANNDEIIQEYLRIQSNLINDMSSRSFEEILNS